MHRLFTKEQVLTIPNLLSLLRLLMIPVFASLYLKSKDYYAAAAVIVLSGVTDVADGIIARKCGMVSDLGKILDPAADKLTQAAVMICLSSRHRLLVALIVVFVLREISLVFFGYRTLKRLDSVNSSQWHGKLSTAALHLVFLVLILFPQLPDAASSIMISACGGLVLLSFFLYIRFYIRLLRDANKQGAVH